MIFGAKIQIFQKLTMVLKNCHFWRENSNETILMIFMNCVFVLGLELKVMKMCSSLNNITWRHQEQL